MYQPISEISVEALVERMQNQPQPIQLVDVREPEEVAIASLLGFMYLPLSEFAQWSETINTRLDTETETIVLCHHGIRSAQMCYWLQMRGFKNVKNVKGGIDAYALIVDNSIPRY